MRRGYPATSTIRHVHVVLVEPEIAPNTGNIIRLCANTGSDLHLVEPLGFSLDDRLLRRGGLDYHERTNLTVHGSLDAVATELSGRWVAFSSHAKRRHTDWSYRDDDVLVFGAEGAGLSASVRRRFSTDHQLTIPMKPNNRSLNLSNAIAVVVYEAWRQADFIGAGGIPAEDSGLTSERPGSSPFDA
jgi:tRNA (cytidine/uridine-2'-O-)-methyltransferase